MDISDPYLDLCQHHLDTHLIKATTFRRGALLSGWPSRYPFQDLTSRRSRGCIRSQSTRSLIRAGFAISNSPVDWEVMITLTFRVAHSNPRGCLIHFMRRLWGRLISEVDVCWFREYQARGVVHYHLLTTEDALAVGLYPLPLPWRSVRRGGRDVRLVTGGLDRFVSRAWIEAVGDLDPGFLAFQTGGIVELLDKPEEAGKYLGSYAGKIAQKTLPDNEVPDGRWWWMSPACTPQPLGVFHVEQYPFDRPHRLVHDASRLELADMKGIIKCR